MKLAISALAGGFVLLLLLLVVTGAGAAAWLMPARNAVGSVEAVDRTLSPPEESERQFPELTPEAKPPVPQPRRVSKPVPQSAQPASPAPAVAPPESAEPAQQPAATNTFSLAFAEGTVAVELRREGEAPKRLPAKVGTGAWNVFAQFNGRDFVPAGSVTVVEGEKLVIACNDVFLQCRSK